MEVRQLIEDRAKLYLKRKATSRQRGLLAGMLEACFEEDPEVKRRSVLLYLCRVDSVSSLKDAEVYALLDWLAPERVEGEWQPAGKAVKEANAILSAFLEERGQRRLL